MKSVRNTIISAIVIMSVASFALFFAMKSQNPQKESRQEFEISHVEFDGRMLIFFNEGKTSTMIETCSQGGMVPARVIEIFPLVQKVAIHIVKKPPYLFLRLDAKSLAELQSILHKDDVAEKVGSDWDGGWEIKGLFAIYSG